MLEIIKSSVRLVEEKKIYIYIYNEKNVDKRFGKC